ncbi:MAG: hypothetical protein Q4D98_10040 [Planctomycetia bacterium]|nr:hypothetical protein [Planctomycetia bacterium]
MKNVYETDHRFTAKGAARRRTGRRPVVFCLLMMTAVTISEAKAQESRSLSFRPLRANAQENFVRPSYTPSVQQEYFFGDTSSVYPDPYTPPQRFVPAEGESRPVPDSEVRARRRGERFANLRKLTGEEKTGREGYRVTVAKDDTSRPITQAPLDDTFSAYPEPVLPAADGELLKSGMLNTDGTTRALPAPMEVAPASPVPAAPAVMEIEEENADEVIELLESQTEILPMAYQEESGRSGYPTRDAVYHEPIRVSKKSTAPAAHKSAMPLSSGRSVMSDRLVQQNVRVPEPEPISEPQKSFTPLNLRPELPATEIPTSERFTDPVARYSLQGKVLPWYASYIRTLSHDEYRLVCDAMADNLGQTSLIRGSIIASRPASAAEANMLLGKYETLEKNVLASLSPSDTEMDKAEKILKYIHANVLTQGYQLEQTTIENLFEGRYNCVTATILYCSLGRKAGLNVTPVELPGHAMCWVRLADGSTMDVETTCKTWFQYRNDPKTRNRVICDLILQANGSSAESASEQDLLANIHPISDRKLLAKIYYNRGVDLLAGKDFAGALEANAIALLFDSSSETTRGNLLATMNNWAIFLCQNGRYEEAAELLRRGIHVDPGYLTFRNNHVHVYHRWVESLYRNGEYDKALQITELAISEQPHEEHFRKLHKQIENGIAAAQESVLR